MAALFTKENFEGGTDGATLTTGNTGATTITGSPTFSDDQRLTGNLSMKIDGTGLMSAYWDFTATGTAYFSWFIYVDSYASGEVHYPVQISSGATNRAQFRLKNSGANFVTSLRNNTSEVYSGTQVASGQWHRFDWVLNNGAGTMQVRRWTGANLFGTTTPDEDSTAVTYNSGTFSRFRAGRYTANTSACVWYMDVLQGDGAGYPALPPQQPTVTDNSGATDSVSLMFTKAALDDSGSTDLTSLWYTLLVNDNDNPTDSLTLARVVSVTDLGTASDSISNTFVKAVSDDEGSTDAVSNQFTKPVGTDDSGATDSVIFAKTKAVTDDTGMTDSRTLQLNSTGPTNQFPQDVTGATDAGQTVGPYGVLIETTGMTDIVSINKVSGFTPPTDATGATDANQFISTFGSGEDPTGMTDIVSFTMTHTSTKVLTFVDDTGIADYNGAPDGLTYRTVVETVTDDTGTTDVVIASKRVTPTPIDDTGITDTFSFMLEVGPAQLDESFEDAILMTDLVTYTLQVAAVAGLVRLAESNTVVRTGRPSDRLWRRYAYQGTVTGLLLFRDGRVIEVTDLSVPEVLTADAVVANAQAYQVPSDSWQAGVLSNAGYMLEAVL